MDKTIEIIITQEEVDAYVLVRDSMVSIVVGEVVRAGLKDSAPSEIKDYLNFMFSTIEERVMRDLGKKEPGDEK